MDADIIALSSGSEGENSDYQRAKKPRLSLLDHIDLSVDDEQHGADMQATKEIKTEENVGSGTTFESEKLPTSNSLVIDPQTPQAVEIKKTNSNMIEEAIAQSEREIITELNGYTLPVMSSEVCEQDKNQEKLIISTSDNKTSVNSVHDVTECSQPVCVTDSDQDIPSVVPESTTESAESETKVAGENSLGLKLPPKLKEFIKLCKRNFCQTKMSKQQVHRKVRTIEKSAGNASDYLKSEEFLKELECLHQEISKTPNKSADLFVKLYKLLVDNANPATNVVNTNDKNDVKRTLMLDSLYEKLEKVKGVIAELGNEEVDFEAEDNSSYIRYQRYNEKAAEILFAIAKLEKHSPHAGMAYFNRLDFTRSKYNEFNLALTKKYRNREDHSFPTFYDVNKCLRKCVKKKNITIREAELKAEKICFKELAKLLKKRRQKDLESIHSLYLTDLKDPAKEDSELDQKLRANKKLGRTKLQDVLTKFTVMQDRGESPEVSEDSEDSTLVETEESIDTD
ncbi:death domain-associated protein 6-like isoform X2 [Atheta coriaria]|uniref:death domain-associated protein 6-like isoform X2 n=1 Tax=Dalotia coriaria TaxID=877792 RepID=UPI0031F33BD0